MKTITCELKRDALDDFSNLCTGLFHPLKGFMTSQVYRSVVQEMSLPDGSIWTLPITLEVDELTFRKAERAERLALHWQGQRVGFVSVEDAFMVSAEEHYEIFQTSDPQHPGLKKELQASPFRIGGACVFEDGAWAQSRLDPARTRRQFRERGWKTVAGFQTRNPVHRAHEYLLRMGLEWCDGLFVNPLIGWKKPGDFSDRAIEAAYEMLLRDFLPGSRIYFAGLSTPMRYAGPREAIFHALVRRNAGCTHFIIGRNHAGVGDYYGDYAAHELARELLGKRDLGIELLLFREPYHCHVCGGVVTDRTCPHASAATPISGTLIRQLMAEGAMPSAILMRPEISRAIFNLQEEMFIKEPNETNNCHSRAQTPAWGAVAGNSPAGIALPDQRRPCRSEAS
jgi:sulfate adenylyltransferase